MDTLSMVKRYPASVVVTKQSGLRALRCGLGTTNMGDPVGSGVIEELVHSLEVIGDLTSNIDLDM